MNASRARAEDSGLAALCRCPECRAGSLAPGAVDWRCRGCGATFRVEDGIPVLLASDSPLLSDRQQREYWSAEGSGDAAYREVDHPIVEGFSRQRWDHVMRYLPPGSVRSALDVGSGNGFSTMYAPEGIDCVAVDGSLALLQRHPGSQRLVADAMRLPFPDDSFDLVFAWELLHHVDEPWRALAEMRRVSRRFVVLFEVHVANPAQFAFALYNREHRWVLRFTSGYLRRQVQQAGLRIEHHQRVGCIFPNVTPPALYPLLRALPFRLPLVGISQFVCAEKVAG